MERGVTDTLQEQGFTKEQINEIRIGREAGLDTSLYENPEFFPIQMRQIRLGLLEELPAGVYARTDYEWRQMEEIRRGLRSQINVDCYASADIPYSTMRQIRLGLEDGVNLSSYKNLDAGVLRQLRKARLSQVNILKYIQNGCDMEQLNQIRLALENGVSLDPYLKDGYRGVALAEIRKGLEIGLDVKPFADPRYNWRQMREIRLGLENRVEISKYTSLRYDWKQMREIRLGLEGGLDVDNYRQLRFPASEMHNRRMALLDSYYEQKLAQDEDKVHGDDFAIEIRAGEMEAWLTILKPDKRISEEDVRHVLGQNRIIKGLKEDVITRIARGQYNIDQPMMVAKGVLPQKGKDGWYEYFFRTDFKKKPKILEDGSVDYQNVEWCETVKKDQKLAYYHDALPGTDGYTVTGHTLKAIRGFEESVLSGRGFTVEEDQRTYRSNMDGVIKLNGRHMEVSNYMDVDEVTRATGNLQFDGSVHILGNVESGAVIKVRDDVVVEGSVGAAKIECGGFVLLKKGMNAAGRGSIHAGKNVTSKFFEAVKVTSGGDIQTNSCLNSQLYAEGKISCTLSLAGGLSTAEGGFRLYNVGNRAGLRTTLRMVSNDRLIKEKREVDASIEEIEQNLILLESSYEEHKEKNSANPLDDKTRDAYLKIENAIFTQKQELSALQENSKKLDMQMKQASLAKVVIDGRAYEGTVVEFNERRWVAHDEYSVTLKNATVE